MIAHKWQFVGAGWQCKHCGKVSRRPVMEACLEGHIEPGEHPLPTYRYGPSTENPEGESPHKRSRKQQAELLAICRSNVCGQYLEGDLCGWQKSKGRAGALMSPRGIPSKAANCKHWPNG